MFIHLRLKHAREALGWSLEKGAKEIGISAEELAKAESGEIEFTTAKLSKAADVYYRTLLWFLEPEAPKPDTKIKWCSLGDRR